MEYLVAAIIILILLFAIIFVISLVIIILFFGIKKSPPVSQNVAAILINSSNLFGDNRLLTMPDIFICYHEKDYTSRNIFKQSY